MAGALQPTLRPLLDRTQTSSQRRQEPISRCPKAVSSRVKLWGEQIFPLEREIPSPHFVSIVCFELLLEVFLRDFFFSADESKMLQR